MGPGAATAEGWEAKGTREKKNAKEGLENRDKDGLENNLLENKAKVTLTP